MESAAGYEGRRTVGDDTSVTTGKVEIRQLRDTLRMKPQGHRMRFGFNDARRGSVRKLSVGVQTDGTYKGRLSLRSLPLGETDAPAPVRAKEWAKGEGVGEGCSQLDCAAWRARTPHLNPLPLAKRRGETNGMRLTTGEHYL